MVGVTRWGRGGGEAESLEDLLPGPGQERKLGTWRLPLAPLSSGVRWHGCDLGSGQG